MGGPPPDPLSLDAELGTRVATAAANLAIGLVITVAVSGVAR